ncbi:type I-E CRISPR-associated protein Cse1/CasA [Uniformispora flossi]|uniref:type I-E CRISPR-associated protein Cse1/CasA n=1 Tax=Uniformispora flossi TaxID=3390723 RepID=UPI003C2AF0F3
MPVFNLVDDPWLHGESAVPSSTVAAGLDGRGYSLRELLLASHRLAGVTVEIPTMFPALLRQVVLPVVVDALGHPKTTADWLGRFRQGEFTPAERERLDSYLDEWRARFDLFDPIAPFGQAGGLHTAKGETKGAALLVATAATGNNVPLFSSRTEGDTFALTPGEAARWLLHTQCWDTAGIKTGAVHDSQAKSGKTTGNPTGPLGQLGVVVPMGRTLYETVWLNIPIRPDGRADRDVPHWRRAPQGAEWKVRSADGVLDLWTWQSRRIRLFPEDTTEGIRVTRVIVAAGDRLRELPEGEPHTAWTLPATGRANAASAPMARRPRRHQPGKATWRGLDALLAARRPEAPATAHKDGFATSLLVAQMRSVLSSLPPDYPLRIDLTGVFYGNQSAVVDDIFHDATPLPLQALSPDSSTRAAILDAVEKAEQLARAVNILSADLRRAAGSEPIPWDRGQRPGELVLHGLDPLMRRMLTGLRAVDEDEALIQRGCLAWEQLAWRCTWQIADRVISTALPSAFGGRTVQQNGRDVAFHLGSAVTDFRRRMREILHRAAEARAAAQASNPVPASTEESVHA